MAQITAGSFSVQRPLLFNIVIYYILVFLSHATIPWLAKKCQICGGKDFIIKLQDVSVDAQIKPWSKNVALILQDTITEPSFLINEQAVI